MTAIGLLKSVAKRTLSRLGYRIQAAQYPGDYPPDFDEDEIADIKAVRSYTMTSDERVVSLTRAVKYIVDNQIPGDIVECGVWRGGSMMAVARSLLRNGDSSRNLYLFDTYEGMSEPTKDDVAFDGSSAQELVMSAEKHDHIIVSVGDVQRAVWSTGYPREKMHFVKGKVEDTVPGEAPASIALLRLDTDWYESTKHELEHLFPRLARGGVLIIDDYGHWEGARKATDQYIKEKNLTILLQRIDMTARISVKM
jgi:hypothetical protein